MFLDLYVWILRLTLVFVFGPRGFRRRNAEQSKTPCQEQHQRCSTLIEAYVEFMRFWNVLQMIPPGREENPNVVKTGIRDDVGPRAFELHFEHTHENRVCSHFFCQSNSRREDKRALNCRPRR